MDKLTMVIEFPLAVRDLGSIDVRRRRDRFDQVGQRNDRGCGAVEVTAIRQVRPAGTCLRCFLAPEPR